MSATTPVASAEGPALAAACVEVESSERARQREIAAYVGMSPLDPYFLVRPKCRGYALLTNGFPVSSYLSAASFPPGLPVKFQETPILNADPTLNALTQMGALRLGVDRAFISLIDRKYQYVVTEITRSHSLVNMKCAPGDHIAIGVCKINNCDGVCPATMKAFMDETGEWVKTGPDVIANRTRYIINNFKTHPDYKDRPYVTAYPFFTSYLEVPLVSPLGYLLGSYCVVDSHCNDFDKDETVEVMNEIASAIMAHLENVRIRQSRDRSEQLIEGLSGFIRHEVPLKPLVTLGEAEPLEEAGKAKWPAGDVLGSVTSSTPNKNDDSSGTVSSFGSGRPPRPIVTSSSSLESAPSALSLASAPQQEGSETPPTTPREELGENAMEQQLLAAIAAAAADGTSPAPPTAPSDISEPHGFISSANIKTSFFRAAATIRRSMDLDGLMFLDAVPSSYVDRPDQPSLDLGGGQPNDSLDGPFCPAIVKSALGPEGETTTHSAQTQLPEVSLQRFIRAYPEGHVFTADELGPIDDSYGVGKTFESRRTADQEGLRLRNDIAALFRLLPAAKYVIFLPLWHFQRECWYAAALGWVEDPTRAIGVADISLVSAFGNSVMAEVSRLEALAASRAKSDFVSSLSHELRSPLHGIMASSELLRDVLSDRALLSTLDMLDSCATTLLDTFNNLLDHAIVTHSGTSSLSGIRNMDLGGLVEDVVEAVKLGHRSGNVFDMQTQTSLAPARRNGSSDRPLLVSVQIARFQWQLPLNVGAWKRIVMNIFGNAFKYTSAGHIEVGLKVVKRADRAGNESDYISFTVEDTGSGMSSDYLKYHLFTPFSQEDNHAPGMGLGLSIVQQLVRDLGGSVNVKSSLGIGTLVEVVVPLGKDAPGSPALGATPSASAEEHRPMDHFSDLKGRTVCLITPEACAAMGDAEVATAKEVRSWSATVERAIRANAGACLGMEVVVGTKDRPIPQADVYILDCNLLNEDAQQSRDNILQAWHTRVAPLVLLCSESGAASCLARQIKKGHGVHLHQPIGPRKLASVLQLALEADSKNGATHIGANDSHSELVAFPRLRATRDASPPEPTLPSRGSLSITEEKEGRPSASETGAVAQMRCPSKQHLLLVDDNPINIKLLTHLVTKLKHTFATAGDGLEAVQLYQRSLEGQAARFDVVFMDISMPVMNGFEATREIRRLETEAGAERCQVIALTGLSSDVNRNEASASGCDLFLTKPVKMNIIKGLLA